MTAPPALTVLPPSQATVPFGGNARAASGAGKAARKGNPATAPGLMTFWGRLGEQQMNER